MLPSSSIISQLVTPAVSHLPPEILSSIFLFITPPVDLFYGPNHMKLLRDTARYTSQVCRQWRFVLLKSPIIWSRVIDFTRGSHLWTEELLRRAANCPLILGSRYRPLSSDILARELEHLSRIVRYDGVFTTETWLLLGKLRQPAPYLEELRLRGSGNGQCKLPARILGRNVPRLRRLWLQSCSFGDDLPYLPQLTHLYISHLNPSLKKWLDILRSMPLLTVLELKDVDTGFDYHGAIHLPNLAVFTMTGSLMEFGVILPCLVLPPTCSMRITALESCSGIDFDITARIITQKLESYSIGDPGIEHRLYLHFGNDFFIISSRTGPALEPKRPPYIFFHISCIFEIDLLSILSHVSSAFAVPLSQVTSLQFGLDSELTSETCLAIAVVLRQANEVKSLVRLDRSTTKIFLQFPGVRRPTRTQTKEDVIFPSLRTIHLTELGTRPYTRGDRVLQSLVDFTQHRISIAAPIMEVYYTKLSSVTWVHIEMEYLKETGVQVTQRDWL